MFSQIHLTKGIIGDIERKEEKRHVFIWKVEFATGQKAEHLEALVL